MLQTESQDIFQNMEPRLVRASTIKRAINFIIDFLSFYFTIVLILLVIVIIYPPALDAMVNYAQTRLNNPDEESFMDNILVWFIYALYMSAVEAIFKGKSLGKLITGTKAVNLNGSRISSEKAFARGLSRSPIPFTFFSAIGIPCNPWQDRWTKTMVIDEKASSMATAKNRY